jgi:hypothetical protein
VAPVDAAPTEAARPSPVAARRVTPGRVFAGAAVLTILAALLNDIVLITAPPVSLVLLLFTAGALVALPWTIVAAIRRRGPPLDVLWVLFGAGVVLVGSGLVARYYWTLARPAFERAAERAQPLVDAIAAYTEAHGEPPPSLSALVPDQLAVVPRTGIGAYPMFEYEAFEDEGGELVWYDLGSRSGRPFSGLWSYPDGDPENAILAFELDGAHALTDARVDRYPDDVAEQPFDAELWRDDRSARMGMARSLPSELTVAGRTTIDDLVRTLGEPDGRRRIRNARWELTVPCSPAAMVWDVFVYWPTHDYPDYMHGGDVERIGDWAYVHE